MDEGLDLSEEAVLADAERLLAALDLPGAELSVLVTDDAAIRELNRQWRGKDEATDVLSFPQLEGEAADGDVLGDVVISLQTAARQAEELGHDLAQEVRILLVHGLCHLLGHDHHDAEDAERMRALEARLLAAIGAGAPGLVARGTD